MSKTKLTCVNATQTSKIWLKTHTQNIKQRLIMNAQAKLLKITVRPNNVTPAHFNISHAEKALYAFCFSVVREFAAIAPLP